MYHHRLGLDISWWGEDWIEVSYMYSWGIRSHVLVSQSGIRKKILIVKTDFPSSVQLLFIVFIQCHIWWWYPARKALHWAGLAFRPLWFPACQLALLCGSFLSHEYAKGSFHKDIEDLTKNQTFKENQYSLCLILLSLTCTKLFW